MYISEEHIGESAAKSDGQRVVELLRAQGWTVVYGDTPWQFVDDKHREAFEPVFQWALAVIVAEKNEPDEKTMETLAKQRLQVDERLRPFTAELIKLRRWSGYWQWLIESPQDLILTWLKTEKGKDAPS